MCTWREIWILPINQQCDVIISEVGIDEYIFGGRSMSGFEVIERGLWSPTPPPLPPPQWREAKNAWSAEG